MPQMYAARVKHSPGQSEPFDPLIFRTATADDVEAIVELWHLTGLGSEPSDDGVRHDRAEIETRLRRDQDLFVVAERAHALVASVMGCYDGHRGWVKRFAVHPDEQRNGVGRQLNAELERRFLVAGVTELRLSAWRSNERALDFWPSMGFGEVDVAYFTKSLR